MTQHRADPLDFAQLYQHLAARSLADQAITAQRYRDLIQRASTGGVDPARFRREYDRLVSEQSSRLAQELAELSASYYQSLLDLNRRYVDQLFDNLVEPDASNGDERVDERRPHESTRPEPQPATTTLELRLAGRVGDGVEAALSIENKRGQPANVTFLISDLMADDGGSPFRAPLHIEPPRLHLKPYEEAPVTLTLPLEPELFTANAVYRGTVLVRGHDDLELLLIIDVSE